jgi:hypothetical protein
VLGYGLGLGLGLGLGTSFVSTFSSQWQRITEPACVRVGVRVRVRVRDVFLDHVFVAVAEDHRILTENSTDTDSSKREKASANTYYWAVAVVTYSTGFRVAERVA